MRMRHLVLLLVLVSMVARAYTIALPPDPHRPNQWHIHVVNGLSNTILLVHCKSKDDDLGAHNLVTGTEFNWSFNVNFWGTTLFWCNLQKPGAIVSFEAFWVEKQSNWLKFRCGSASCIWTAKDDGIYLKNIPHNVDELIHKWVPAAN